MLSRAGLSLRPYQHDGVSFLAGTSAGLLADEMGLGKSVQAAVAARLAYERGVWRRALLISPASLQLHWARELHQWTPDLTVRAVIGDALNRRFTYLLPIPVLLATYEQVRSDSALLRQRQLFDLVILDEAQRIKNAGSETSLTCRLIPRTLSWALSGTPLENRPEDLISIFRFLTPGTITRGMSASELHAAIRPHFLRRTKEQVLPELPPIIRQEIPVTLTGAQLLAYEDAWLSRSESIENEHTPDTTSLLATITRLKQLCNFDAVSGESAKWDALNAILDQLALRADKVIVFSQYVRTLTWLADRIELPHELLHGGQNSEERDGVVRRFEERPGPRVLLASLKAGGVGLNLKSASTIVLFDSWWNPAVEAQAVNRGHRFGRTLPLHVIKFVVVDTIEEHIERILAVKRELFEQFVDAAPVAVPLRLTRTEMLRILRLPDSPISYPMEA